MLIAAVDFADHEKLLSPLLDFAESICRELGIGAAKSSRLRLAFEEILKERMAKAYKNGGLLTLEINLTGSYLELGLKDKGEPYWLGEPEYDPRRIGESAEGLETFLVTKMVDVFGSEKLGRDGQRLYLRIELPNDFQLQTGREEAEEQPPLDNNFSVRRVIDDDRDVINAISCLYHEYGYSYGFEGIYYPDTFKELSRANLYCSYLAANEHNEIGGHGALGFTADLPNMPELCGLVVKRRFRGQHLSRMLLDHRLTEAERMGLPAVWGEPVAFHTGAQTNFKNCGFTATGIHFNFMNSDLQSPYNRGGERLPIAICVKLLDKTGEDRVYAPRQLAAFIRAVYGRLGGSFQLLPPETAEGESRLRMDINSRLQSGKIVAMKAGRDFRQELSSMLRTAAKQRLQLVEVWLSLTDPGVADAYEVLKSLGFFFSGLLPGSGKGCYAIMQNLMGDEPDFDRPVTRDDFTEVVQELRKIYEQG